VTKKRQARLARLLGRVDRDLAAIRRLYLDSDDAAPQTLITAHATVRGMNAWAPRKVT